MKNIRFIALIALMLGGMTMKAQEYHPIVEDGKQWNVLFSYPWNPPEPPHRYTDIYKIEGDTLLDGVSYKVMYTTRNEDLTDWNCWGFLRETEDRQVFSRRPSTSDEQLLYDFSMQIGDTIFMYEDYMVVVEIGEVLVGDEPRQQIVLEYPFGETETWIEGIGSLYGIIDSGSHFLVGGSTDLLCYYEDGDLIWQNSYPSINSCYFVYSGGGQSGLVVTPTVLTFDEPAMPQTFTISNQLDVDVTITNIYVQPDDNIVLVSHTDLPQTLQPDESMDVQVELNAIGNKGYNTYHIYVLTSEGTKVVVVRVNENAWNSFAPLGAEWYFHVLSQGPITEPPFHYIQYMVTGEEEKQGHTCSVINGYEYVYEEDGVVYWYNSTDEEFTVLYDFNAEAGESWYCAVADYYPCLITVDSVGSVTWDGHTYRTQYVTGVIEDYWTVMDGRIIEGIGYEKGLFPEVVIDGPEYEYMRCYLVDGEMLYHEGDYDCDYVPQTGSPCWDGSVADAYEGGDGTEGNPYQIATPQQLALLAQQTNTGTGGDAHYILVNDICLNVENDSIDWPVIGKETSQNLPIYFTGVFDGNGHTIERMIIRENHMDAGLFGHTRGAVIKNLRVADASIQVGSDVGIIVGQAYNTSIINCTVQNSSISHEHNSNNYVGGIVGGYYPTDNASDTVYIKDCVSEVRFLNPERFFIAGGIVGRCMTMSVDGGYAVIENCENRSDVRGSHHVGGIMGDADNSHNGESLALIIKGCRNYGTISSTTFCGGIVAHSWGIQMIGCLNMGEVVARDVNSDVLVGGLAALLKESVMVECVNKGNVISESNFGTQIGGLVGYNDASVIANSYNLGTIAAPNSTPANSTVAIGGIVGGSTGRIFNVYNAGALTVPETPSGAETGDYGHILGAGDVAEHYLNCYWLEQDTLPACGNMELPGSSSFVAGLNPSEWILNEAQYGTTDLVEALNFGAAVVLDSVPEYPYLTTWVADTENTNQGLPILASIPEPNETFQSGDLLYSIISTDPPHVSVVGHVDGENAQGELDIPSTVDYEGTTYTVTEIGEWAFKNCVGLTGQFAIPSTIDTIQQGAFYGCSGFTGTLDLSFSTVAFKENVFRECSGFMELYLPLFISEIPRGLFCGCSGLTGTLVLPETVEIIGEGAFARCSGFTGLVLPNGLREIREQAFAGCTGFTGSLVFPETVTHIKYQAFGHCSGFSGDLIIPNSVVELGNTQNSNYYIYPEPYSTFEDCFDHLVLSQSLDTIGPRCFWGCTRLTGDLVMPEGLKAVFSYAFEGCTGLTGLILNNSLAIIGSYAFSGCSGIRGTVTFPENISVGKYAFEWCEGIEALALPHNIVFTNNGGSQGHVFQGCTSLTELDIPEGWTATGQSNFALCRNLQSVHLPESLTIIDWSCFSECTNLSEINIPEGVTEIGHSAFSKCSSLTHIELPASLRTLGGQAFARCTSLTGEIVIPDLVQRVELMTFDSCYMLQSIVFGDSINYITEPAFENTELSSLVLKAMTPPQLQRMSSPNAWHFPADIPIIVPCGTLEVYQNSEDWGDFTNITEDCGSGLIEFHGSEWYYEIVGENGSVTYQHLEYVADTTINHKDVQIIIRTNTLYDKGEHSEMTREYLYEEDDVVYWWNKDLQEFTVLYDLGAQPGDSWVIKVGTETLTMHVDAVNQYYYEGQLFRMLRVSDEDDLFSGTIVCGVGHLSSFFPERLMTRGKGYRVQGLRCYWNYGNLLFTLNRDDCDAIYAELHNGVDEPTEMPFAIYPNPTHDILIVETQNLASLTTQTYYIVNLMGQTVLTGTLNAETQQIDVSNLPQGMYFISVGDVTRKFIVNK